MANSIPGERRDRGRWVRRLALSSLAVVAAYLALALHPQPLFAYSVQRGNVVLYARQPLPPEAASMLDDVIARIGQSPLYDAARTHHVFLCDSPRLFAFFTLWNRNAGAVAQVYGTGNVFVRPTNVQRGRVIGASGIEKGGERTLAYYVAHEVTHAMTADRIGRWQYHELATFQVEGYADYVAFAQPVDIARGRADLVAGTFDMDPQRSGHYDRYRLLVAYLLQERHYSVDALLAQRLSPADVEKQLREPNDEPQR